MRVGCDEARPGDQRGCVDHGVGHGQAAVQANPRREQGQPFINRHDEVRMSRKMMFVSSAKAERELDWRVIPVDEALRRSVEWFRANGYVGRHIQEYA